MQGSKGEEELDDDEDVEHAFDEYEDDALIDDDELDAATAAAAAAQRARSLSGSGSRSGNTGLVQVSADFREAVRRTAREHFDALKTTSARPRKQQSAVSSSASSAAAAGEAGSNGKDFLSSRDKGLTGWEGADPDDMGAATSRTERPRPGSSSNNGASSSGAAVASSRPKRPESAGRRRKDILAADDEMDRMDSIILAQTQKRDERRRAEEAAGKKSSSSHAAASSSKSSTGTTVAKSVMIPRLAFGVTSGAVGVSLPISSAMSVSRSAPTASTVSVSSSVSAASSLASWAGSRSGANVSAARQPQRTTSSASIVVPTAARFSRRLWPVTSAFSATTGAAASLLVLPLPRS
jgi:hypothetical protein